MVYHEFWKLKVPNNIIFVPPSPQNSYGEAPAPSMALWLYLEVEVLRK